MKNSKVMRSLAAMSLVIALFAVGSRAAYYTMPAGSFSVTTCEGEGGANNPNGFGVALFGYTDLSGTFHHFGFLLNGSELASNWLKTLQEACINNRSVAVYTDDNWAHAYSGKIAENGWSAGAYKILSIVIY